MPKETPLGMRIGESAFCVGYLIFAFAAGSIFTARANASGNMQAGLHWVLLAVMTFLLACGDTFHLVPRVLRNIAGKGAREDDKGAAVIMLCRCEERGRKAAEALSDKKERRKCHRQA